ncbi:hypothetical protein C9374_013098 [Naegleria lovaniensis]|uniref:N-alpha-acetyltransferase 60 n=1 Tax=Naegleria lovaniensis TaxID=51637 RepID=A0AA88GC55_NAELO|nr:uncharacterized protein C9374_013098 [Naegleria lovaniensis]KAG2372818.1 hypothetical protein C9374_013098 [Naegleria lovaniensis]
MRPNHHSFGDFSSISSAGSSLFPTTSSIPLRDNNNNNSNHSHLPPSSSSFQTHHDTNNTTTITAIPAVEITTHGSEDQRATVYSSNALPSSSVVSLPQESSSYYSVMDRVEENRRQQQLLLLNTTSKLDSTTNLPNCNHQHHESLSSPLHMYNKIIFEDSEYLYRNVTRDDLPSLKKLQQELFPVQYNKQFYLKLLDKSKTYTLLSFSKEHNELIGVCSSSILTEEKHDGGFWQNLFGYPDKYNICYIMTLGVKKNHRRKGLASRMLQILEEVVSAEPYFCTKLTLHCKVDNERALSFYRQNAFFIKEKIDGYYDFGSHMEAAFKLEKNLSIENEHFNSDVNFLGLPSALSGLLTSESRTSIAVPRSSGSTGSFNEVTPVTRTNYNNSSSSNSSGSSSLGCLSLTIQLWRFFMDSLKIFTKDSLTMLSTSVVTNSSQQHLAQSALNNPSSPGGGSLPNPRPRIVLQIQEQECE